MKPLTFTFFYDKETGWLQVPMPYVEFLGLEHLSNKSYKDGSYAYLNEDSDVDVFYLACKQSKLKIDLCCSFADGSFVRDLRPFASQISQRLPC